MFLHKKFFPGLRITGLAFAAAILFSPAVHADVAPLEGQILCPDMDGAKPKTVTDEYDLARAYDKGYCGYTTDKNLAVQWYTAAAAAGHMLAQYELAEMYFTGDGIPTDYPKAKQWYLAAAKQGHGLSQLRLAFLYAEAHFTGLTTDYAEAEKWFLQAAEQNAGDAQFRLGNFYRNYKRPPDLKKAIYWLTKASEGGNRVAMFDLGRMLRDGQGTAKDPVQGVAWLKKAAEQDLIPAQAELADMYEQGKGVAKDPVQSFTWILKVAAHPAAAPYWIDKAGDVYYAGWDTITKDYGAAIDFYQRAANMGDAHAKMRVGEMYLKGLGVSADASKAREYLEKAAEQGNIDARIMLEQQKEGNIDGKPASK